MIVLFINILLDISTFSSTFIFLFKKRFLLSLVLRWYFTLALGPRAGLLLGVPGQYLARERGQVWKWGLAEPQPLRTHCPAWASVSSLGPWEGPGAIQCLMMPKISGDRGLSLSQ